MTRARFNAACIILLPTMRGRATRRSARSTRRLTFPGSSSWRARRIFKSPGRTSVIGFHHKRRSNHEEKRDQHEAREFRRRQWQELNAARVALISEQRIRRDVEAINDARGSMLEAEREECRRLRAVESALIADVNRAQAQARNAQAALNQIPAWVLGVLAFYREARAIFKD